MRRTILADCRGDLVWRQSGSFEVEALDLSIIDRVLDKGCFRPAFNAGSCLCVAHLFEKT